MATANMKKIVRAAIVTGLVSTLGVGLLAADASPYQHPGVVSTSPVMTMPILATTAGEPKPVAYTVAEAGNQMVVGGRFATVENGNRTVQYPRRNVFAFNATTGAVNTGLRPERRRRRVGHAGPTARRSTSAAASRTSTVSPVPPWRSSASPPASSTRPSSRRSSVGASLTSRWSTVS